MDRQAAQRRIMQYRGNVADIRPFRREKRLKSLDECNGPRLRFAPMPAPPVSGYFIFPIGLLIGAGLGYLLIF